MDVINVYKPIHYEVEIGDYVYIYYTVKGKVERFQGRVRFIGLHQLHPVEIEFGDGRVGIFSTDNIIAWGLLKYETNKN